MRVLPFTARGYRFEDSRGLARDERHRTLGLLLDGLGRVSPEIRCAGNPLEGTVTPTTRTARTELSAEQTRGDLLPMNFAAFDPQDDAREVVGAFHLYGIRVVSQSPTQLVVRARPMPAFNHLDGKDYAEFALDMMEYLVGHDLRLDDGRALIFDAIEFSTYYRAEGDPERTDADARVEWVDREFDRRRLRVGTPLQGSKTLDPMGRRLTTIRRPVGR